MYSLEPESIERHRMARPTKTSPTGYRGCQQKGRARRRGAAHMTPSASTERLKVSHVGDSRHGKEAHSTTLNADKNAYTWISISLIIMTAASRRRLRTGTALHDAEHIHVRGSILTRLGYFRHGFASPREVRVALTSTVLRRGVRVCLQDSM